MLCGCEFYLKSHNAREIEAQMLGFGWASKSLDEITNLDIQYLIFLIIALGMNDLLSILTYLV
jgi:hypothetical protein